MDIPEEDSVVDIPVIQQKFLELKKVRETELKSLHNTAIEFWEENAPLEKHVDMTSAAEKLEFEAASAMTKEDTEELEKQF